MKITYMLTWADAMGGTEVAAYAQASALADRHATEVLSVFRTADRPFFSPGDGVPIRYLVDARSEVQRPVRPCSLGDDELAALTRAPSELVDPAWEGAFNRLTDIEVRAALARIETDVLVTTTPSLSALSTALAPARAVTVGQEHRISELRQSSAGPLLSRTPLLDALVVLTEPTRAWIAESLGAAAPRLEAIPNAVPAGFQARSSLDSKIVLVARRLVGEKQVDHAVRAFAELAGRHPDWRLRVCGDGPDKAGLVRLAQDLGVSERVEFLGNVPTMDEEWAKASVCLLPSDTEAFGLVLTEAFAAGVPAVAYDCPTGPSEVIRHGVDGLLAPPGEVEGLAAALGELMADDALRSRMGQAALDGVQRFDTAHVTALWDDLYTELAGTGERERVAARADRAARAEAATERSGARFRAVPWQENKHQVPGRVEAERRLHRALPHLVRSGGQLTEVRDGLLPDDAFRGNLDLVVDALEAAGTDHAVLPGDGARHRVMVPADRAEDALRAVAAHLGEQAVYAQPLRARGGLPQAVPAALAATLAQARGARVYRPVITSTRTLRYGHAFGADLEFWPWDEERGGHAGPEGELIPPEAAVPARVPIAGPSSREYATFEPWGRAGLDEVDFPIDAVFTWVDGSDPAWRDRRDAALGRHTRARSSDSTDPNRFTDSGELRYALRAIAMHAPWINRIHLVTDDQTPDWLDTAHPRIRVVDHRDIFPDTAHLPTFNSHAIESRLHHVPGLSEHFLYFNDDIFLGRRLRPVQFFLPNGAAKFFRSPTRIPFGDPLEDEPAYFAAGKRNRELIERDFGRTPVHGFLHAPHALRRSVLHDVEDRYPDPVARTTANRFRSPDDVSLPSSLAHHFGHLTGAAVPAGIRSGYVDVGDPDQHLKLDQLLARRAHDVFCVTDSPPERVPRAEQSRMISAFLRAYFPFPAPWEHTAHDAHRTR